MPWFTDPLPQFCIFISPGEVMTQAELQKHIYKTYFLLRVGLCLLAFFSFLAVGNWRLEQHPFAELDQRLLLRLRSTNFPIARFPWTRGVRRGSLRSWVFPDLVQRLLKNRKLGAEHSGSRRPPCRPVSYYHAGLLHKLRERQIFFYAFFGGGDSLCLHCFCCLGLHRGNLGSIA